MLLVNQYYPPDTSATAGVWRDVAHRLAAAGHRVTVLAGRPSYDPRSRRPWAPLRTEQDGPVTVERVGSAAFGRDRPAGRAATYLTYLAAAAARARSRSAPDVAVAGSDPPLAVGVALAAARGRPVVYAVQDLHPDMAIAAGMLPAGRFARAWDRAHTRALRRCTRVVCPGQAMADRVRGKGVPADRVTVLRTGAWPPSGQPERQVVARLRAGAPFVAVHAGNLGGAGPWDTLLAATRLLDGDARLLFVGDGIHAQRLRDAGASVAGFRPRHQIPSVMAAGDLQVVAQRADMAGLVVPSKLYTALAHGRPVLAVVPARSEVASIVREHGCGVVADPADPAAIAAAIRAARSDPAHLAALADGAAAAGRALDRGRLLDRFVALVEQAADRPAPRHPPARPVR